MFAMFANEDSHGMFEGGTWVFSGAGSYYCWLAWTDSSINWNADATTSITYNCANATECYAAQNSNINQGAGTNMTVTITALGWRARARNRSHVSYGGTTAATNPNVVDGASTVAYGTFPFQTKETSTIGGYQDFEEIAAPANPAANTARFYAKDNGSGVTKLYYRDSAGTETEVGGAGGGATLGANTFTGQQLVQANTIQPFKAVRTGTGQTQIGITSGGTNAWESAVINAERWNGSTGTPSVLSSGMDILTFNGAAWQSGSYNGGVYEAAGTFGLDADGAHGSGSVPGRWYFSTTPSGSTSPVERLNINANGSIVIGTAALATNATAGFLYIPTMAGTPTGAPTAYTGRAPLTYDSTGQKLYFYTGGSWVQVGGGSGGISRTVVVTSGNTTMGSAASTDYVYFVAGLHTMSLPTAVGNTNKYVVKNNHSANITVDTAGAENVEGVASISIPPESSFEFVSDNTNWWIIG
jgi:hypothetical protein